MIGLGGASIDVTIEEAIFIVPTEMEGSIIKSGITATHRGKAKVKSDDYNLTITDAKGKRFFVGNLPDITDVSLNASSFTIIFKNGAKLQCKKAV